jgi:hypothetical protein
MRIAASKKGKHKLGGERSPVRPAMTERWNHSQKEEITSKMQELTGCMCVVTFKPEGDRRGIIERIETLNLAKDFPESFERSQFKVQLTSGEIVVVSGSAISEIESTTAGSHSAPARKKPDIKARRARQKSRQAKSGSQSRPRPPRPQQRS